MASLLTQLRFEPVPGFVAEPRAVRGGAADNPASRPSMCVRERVWGGLKPHAEGRGVTHESPVVTRAARHPAEPDDVIPRRREGQGLPPGDFALRTFRRRNLTPARFSHPQHPLLLGAHVPPSLPAWRRHPCMALCPAFKPAFAHPSEHAGSAPRCPPPPCPSPWPQDIGPKTMARTPPGLPSCDCTRGHSAAGMRTPSFHRSAGAANHAPLKSRSVGLPPVNERSHGGITFSPNHGRLNWTQRRRQREEGRGAQRSKNGHPAHEISRSSEVSLRLQPLQGHVPRGDGGQQHVPHAGGEAGLAADRCPGPRHSW